MKILIESVSCRVRIMFDTRIDMFQFQFQSRQPGLVRWRTVSACTYEWATKGRPDLVRKLRAKQRELRGLV